MILMLQKYTCIENIKLAPSVAAVTTFGKEHFLRENSVLVFLSNFLVTPKLR